MRCEIRDDEAMMRWMRREGDALLRTCYLLCGDVSVARGIAKQAFASAWSELALLPACDERTAVLVLLRKAMRLCPCRGASLFPCARRGIVPRLQALPSGLRRVALLCLYHDLTPSEAALVLSRDETLILRDLRRARKLLRV